MADLSTDLDAGQPPDRTREGHPDADLTREGHPDADPQRGDARPEGEFRGTASGEPPRTPPPLRPRELARWIWRQLTSMRTALILLFLLALAAVPGSIIPQEAINPIKVAQFTQDNPELAQWYQRFGLFDVFGSPWFGAIYLALLVSLLGCIVPRARQHLAAMRARPPATPRRLARLPEYRERRTGGTPDEVVREAAQVLRRRRFRVVEDGSSVAAERGYLREVGNLVFHVAIVVILLGVAAGSLLGFKGTALVVEGRGFANTVTQYDGYQAGALTGPGDLPPFALTVRKFDASFQKSGPTRGAATNFDAFLDYTEHPGGPRKSYDLGVNHPLNIGGAQIFLIQHGYAPSFTVRDSDGEVAYSGPVPFLPQDGNYTSTGVVKVPDAQPDGLGFEGFFLPTATVDPQLGPRSVFPAALRPAVYLTAYHGDLGMNDGIAQSIYKLDTSQMKQFQSKGSSGKDPLRLALTPGQTAKLPDGRGSITFDGYKDWVNLQISRNPGTPIVFAGAVLALAGLLASLFVRRRRVWVRVGSDETGADGTGTVAEVAGLDRTEGGDLGAELDEIADRIAARAPGGSEPLEEEQS